VASAVETFEFGSLLWLPHIEGLSSLKAPWRSLARLPDPLGPLLMQFHYTTRTWIQHLAAWSAGAIRAIAPWSPGQRMEAPAGSCIDLSGIVRVTRLPVGRSSVPFAAAQPSR
jgi:hypothetical protein